MYGVHFLKKFYEQVVHSGFMGAYASFTVHLNQETADKIAEMKEQNPNFSRNALIRLAIMDFRLDGEYKIDSVESEIYDLKHRINALFKQNNPDWKRKKNLPYHFKDEYQDIPNYTES